jgi:TetR/AcrR family tetracycline transcriptional repressor
MSQSCLHNHLRRMGSRGPYGVSDIPGQGGLAYARMRSDGDRDERNGRSPLSRERILDAAIAFVDARGLTALTMRRLGTELGVEAMSLYRYVDCRDDLLEGMVDEMVDRLHLDPDGVRPGPGEGWQAYLQWLAHGVRGLAREHPNVFPLIATRHPAAPWLRPPLRSLRVVEDFLSTLVARGFTDDGAVAAYRAFSSFLLGHLLLEATVLGSRTAPAMELTDVARSMPTTNSSVDMRDYPLLRRLEDQLSEDHASAEFERALEDLLDRIKRELADVPE